VFSLFNGEAGALSWSGMVGSTGLFCILGNQVSWNPQSGMLPCSGGARLSFSDWIARALLQESLVMSTGPPCFVGREAASHQQNSKSWSPVFTCMCGCRLLTLNSKLSNFYCYGAIKPASLNLPVPSRQQRS
jgi:hypothetical protein